MESKLKIRRAYPVRLNTYLSKDMASILREQSESLGYPNLSTYVRSLLLAGMKRKIKNTLL